jgi:hypothetical protein
MAGRRTEIRARNSLLLCQWTEALSKEFLAPVPIEWMFE